MEEKRMVNEENVRELLLEAVKKAKIDAYMHCIKIMHDTYSRGSFRVIVHNCIVELEGGERA
jgi:hypothetical protein